VLGEVTEVNEDGHVQVRGILTMTETNRFYRAESVLFKLDRMGQRFHSLEEMQDYVDQTLERWYRETKVWRQVKVTLNRRAKRVALARLRDFTIIIPARRDTRFHYFWTEYLLLHELAHLLGNTVSHQLHYRETLCRLLDLAGLSSEKQILMDSVMQHGMQMPWSKSND